jgi:uncharacterized membrane protein
MAEGHIQTEIGARLKTNRLLLLFALGFVLVIAGMIVLVASAFLSSGGSESYGVVIFIGPIPLVIGGGPEALWLILFGLMLATLSITILVFMRKKL